MGANFERNHTAHLGRHALRAEYPGSAPDSLIHELTEILRREDTNLIVIGDQFKREGFTNSDLVLGPPVSSHSATFAWMIDALKFQAGAELDSPGAWTWAVAPPSIADRVGVYLYVLGIDRENVDGVFFAGAREMAQRKLNDLLLDHPVLFHPRVHVNVSNPGAKTGSCSIPHAIAMSLNAHFPMESDWPAGQAPLERLRNFANSRVVQAGITFKSQKHVGELAEVKGLQPLASAVKLNGSRPGLLTSLFSLGRRATVDWIPNGNGVDHPLGIFLSDWSRVHKAHDVVVGSDHSESSVRASAVIAKSFFGACGVKSGRRSVSSAKLFRDPAMFEFIRALDAGSQKSLQFQLGLRVLDVIFELNGPAQLESCVAHNLDSVINGLVESGITVDHQESANLIKAQLKNSGAPNVEAVAALGFLRAMRTHGADLEPSDFLNAGFATNAKVPPGWDAALHVDSTEREMNSVINRVQDQVLTPPLSSADGRSRSRLRTLV